VAAKLEYQIGVTGADRMKRVMRGIGTELKAQQRRVAATNRESLKATQGRSGTSGLAAAEARRIAAERRLEASRHRARMADLRTENAAKNASHRTAMAQIRSEIRASKAVVREGRRGRAAGVRSRTAALNRFQRGAGNIGGTLRTGAGILAGSLAIGGGLAISNAVNKRFEASTTATGIANRAAIVPGENRSRGEIKGNVLGLSERLEKESGRDQRTILDGIDKFLEKTGDLKAAEQLSGRLVDLADAIGLNDDAFRDFFQSAALNYAGMQGLGYSGKDLQDKTVELSSIAMNQSAIGQIGVPDLAKLSASFIAAGSRIEGDAGKNLARVVGLSNTSVTTASDTPEIAATAINRFTDDMISNSKSIKNALGIETTNEKGQVKDLSQLIPALVSAMDGDLRLVTDRKAGLGLGKRSKKIIEPFMGMYNAAGGGEKGIDAIKRELAKFDVNALTESQVSAGKKHAREDEARRVAMAFNELNKELADSFVPLLTRMIPRFEALIPTITALAERGARFAEWLGQNPFSGLGVIMGTLIAKELAMAGIANAIKKAIAGGGGGIGIGTGAGVGTGPGGQGGASRLNKVTSLAALGGTAFVGGMALGEALSSGDEQSANIEHERNKGRAEIGTDRYNLMSNMLAKEAALKEAQQGPTFMQKVGGFLGGPDAEKVNQQTQSRLKEEAEALRQQWEAGSKVFLDSVATAGAAFGEVAASKLKDVPSARRESPMSRRL